MYCEKTHDPFSTLSSDEISNLYLTGEIPKEDFILSTYITNFIERAINDYKDFLTMDYNAQHEILEKYVYDKMEEKSMSNNVKTEVINEEKDVEENV